MRSALLPQVALVFGAGATAVCFPLHAEEPVVSSRKQWATTVYVARISGERTWQHIVTDPFNAEFVDAYLAVVAVSRVYASRFNGALQLEAEGQAAYNFGDQRHLELNAVPIVLRWQRFPWSARVHSTAAFGLGVSYATELPEVEQQLEDETHKTMVYWVVELTAGPRNARWAASLRLHHRSDGFGLMGEDGGANAIGLGVRYAF